MRRAARHRGAPVHPAEPPGHAVGVDDPRFAYRASRRPARRSVQTVVDRVPGLSRVPGRTLPATRCDEVGLPRVLRPHLRDPAAWIPPSAPQGVDPPQAGHSAARGDAPAAQLGASGEPVGAGYPRPGSGGGHRVGAGASRGVGGATSEPRGGGTNRERQRRDATVRGPWSQVHRARRAGTRATPRTGEQPALEAGSTERAPEARGVRASERKALAHPFPLSLTPIPQPSPYCLLLRANPPGDLLWR